MAVVNTLSNHFKYMLATGEIDFSSDSFKIILMDSAFAFDKDAHATLSDVTANQLSTGNGYTQDSKELSGVSISEDDTNDRAGITWNSVVWTASGGTIGPSGSAIIYDDSTSDDTVVGCIDYGEDVSATTGNDFEIDAPGINLA